MRRPLALPLFGVAPLWVFTVAATTVASAASPPSPISITDTVSPMATSQNDDSNSMIEPSESSWSETAASSKAVAGSATPQKSGSTARLFDLNTWIPFRLGSRRRFPSVRTVGSCHRQWIEVVGRNGCDRGHRSSRAAKAQRTKRETRIQVRDSIFDRSCDRASGIGVGNRVPGGAEVVFRALASCINRRSAVGAPAQVRAG